MNSGRAGSTTFAPPKRRSRRLAEEKRSRSWQMHDQGERSSCNRTSPNAKLTGVSKRQLAPSERLDTRPAAFSRWNSLDRKPSERKLSYFKYSACVSCEKHLLGPDPTSDGSRVPQAPLDAQAGYFDRCTLALAFPVVHLEGPDGPRPDHECR